MARVSLETVSKHFADVHAVSGLDLDVRDGEVMVIVGPSGCGKTTALRLVAGFEQVTAGVVRIGDRIVNGLTPKERDIAMVFQHYALYPHLTVADNIGLGLKLRGMRRRERTRRVREAAALLGLDEHLGRKPAQLSGGQRQRVAMGRALVREPAAFLMDEPLSNLDARLRVEMRTEIVRVHRRLGVATLYVTHDQAEAMTIGDRVAVMRAGVLQQCDAPQVVYERPANLFVAAFVGSPPMNLYAARLARTEDGMVARIGDQGLALPARSPALLGYGEREVVVGIRPEALRPTRPDPSRDATLHVTVELVETLGAELLVHFSGPAPRIVPDGAGPALGVAKAAARTPVTPGRRLALSVDRRRLAFFEPETGLAVA